MMGTKSHLRHGDLQAAVLINYDPTAPSRLLSTMETMEETMAARFWCLCFLRMPHLLQCLLPPNHCYAWSRYVDESDRDLMNDSFFHHLSRKRSSTQERLGWSLSKLVTCSVSISLCRQLKQQAWRDRTSR
ncbi:hypothetical protein YC2023_119942 [Brassica napus]